MNLTTTIIAAVLGSNAIFAFLQFMISRHDTKKDKNESRELGSIQSKLVTLEKDVLRTQMLVLITLKPEEQQEILTLSRYYFVDLDGDWYMSSIFKRWCKERCLEPEWFEAD